MRRSHAVPFKLGAGEERAGEDITIPLSKMHFISGVVTAAGDGHPLRTANLYIEDPQDKDRIVVAAIGTDGTFHLEGVPEGTFILRITDASDKEEVSAGDPERRITRSEDKTLRRYSDLEQSIRVEGDMPNLVLAVPEQKTRAAASQSSKTGQAEWPAPSRKQLAIPHDGLV